MKRHGLLDIALALLLALCAAQASHAAPDPRLRDIFYDPQAVVTVPVQRGVLTLIALDADEAITEVGAGLGSDCSKPDAAWCITAQPGGRHVFVKPKSSAQAPNTLAVITDRRVHTFRLVLVEDAARQSPVYRLTVRAPLPMATPRLEPAAASPTLNGARTLASPLLPAADPATLLAERLQAKPLVRNSAYSIAEGAQSQDILPSLVFDDGRFTYLRFAGNREVPAVFQVLGDGSETLVNARMEDDLLVVDRVARRLTLRAGQAVVAVWNDAFDLDGAPPTGGMTVRGVIRRLQSPERPAVSAGDNND